RASLLEGGVSIDAEIEKSKAQQIAIAEEIKSVECLIEETMMTIGHLDFWVRGFGNAGLPSKILDDAVAVIESSM
ncbi:MAG: hypothetical protein COX41_05505, partial [Candidatus Omnitrophica bacterium CG23_combo_of_CG06-09_8_20_14_all_41_10]